MAAHRLGRFIVGVAVLVLTAACWTPASAEVRVSPLSEGAIAPDAEVGADGAIHQAYFRADDIFYRRSNDGGRSWSDPLRANSEPKTAFAGAFRGPDLDVAADGRVHVIWYTSAYQMKLPKEEWGIHYASLAPGAGEFAPARNLNRMPSDNYSVAAGPGGKVAAVWTAEALFVNFSEDGGKTFGDAIQVTSADPCECCATRAIFTRDGELTVLYREKKDNIRDMHLVTWRPDGDVSGPTRLSSEAWMIEGCPMTGSDLHTATDGGIVAGWETRGKIRFARMEADGTMAVPGVVAVADRGRYPVVLGNGTNHMVGWKDGGKLHWAEFDSKGTATGRAGSFESGNGSRPAGVVTVDGDYVLFP